MIEPKFKAWDIGNKVFIYNIQKKQYVDLYDCEMSFDDWFGTEGKEKSWIIYQYTGIKDKNNKEIYEGDIVKYNNDIWEVNDLTEWLCWFGQEGISSVNWKCELMEIVGNIYENQEMIK